MWLADHGGLTEPRRSTIAVYHNSFRILILASRGGIIEQEPFVTDHSPCRTLGWF